MRAGSGLLPACHWIRARTKRSMAKGVLSSGHTGAGSGGVNPRGRLDMRGHGAGTGCRAA
ncbi:hypothetical protein Srubr_81280 [Streptomyces rubradiris]|uniref:Uncharacterized protein n=1 Tax=Streptomyces rubradiris TaxID=285531 RepID=A0ABQ3RR04_STRRR|nr:hypothetical protein Srubr_81280 [Streptomyces rubradiris]